MFEPGHLHLTHSAISKPDVSYSIDLHYATCTDPVEGSCMLFKLTGTIAGKAFQDQFQLTRDSAFNFASNVDRMARKYGLPASQALPLIEHHQYDQMFADIRQKLNLRSGEPMQPQHIR